MYYSFIFIYVVMVLNWENNKSYTNRELQFSASKLFFQHQNEMLQKIWFISPMTIDIHFKYTFQEVQSDYFIEWGEFEWLTLDHDVHEQGIVYKMWFLRPKFQNVENLSVDLKKKSLNNSSIWSLLRGFLWWCIVFALLFLLSSKSQFWQVLFRLNIIWAWVLLCFYIWKFSSFMYKKAKVSNIEYWGFKVDYAKQSDALMLSEDVLKVLNVLGKEYRIVRFCYTWNCIYLLQDLHDRNWDSLVSTSKLYSEQEKANLQQKTMSYIRQSDFLSRFSL